MNKVLFLLTTILTLLTSEAFAQRYESIDPRNGFEIELRTISQCTWGDLDLIAMERFEHTRKGGDSDFVISLETFDDTVPLTTSIRGDLGTWLSEGGNTSPRKVSLPKPTNSEPKVGGIFICKRSQGARPCRNLQVYDFNEIIGRHAVKGDHSGNVVRRDPALYAIDNLPPDSVYYFYPIVISADKITAFTSALTEDQLLNISETFHQIGASDYYNSGDVVKNVKLVRSAPLKVEGNKIVVTIPHSNQAKCSGATDTYNNFN